METIFYFDVSIIISIHILWNIVENNFMIILE